MKTLSIETIIMSVALTTTACAQQKPSVPRSWATTIYQDEATGVSFQYPAEFRETKDVAGYFSPALTTMKGVAFHARLAYKPPPVPNVDEATTDLGELAFLFATKPAASADGCNKLIEGYNEADNDSSPEAIVEFNGVAFHTASVSGAGLSHFEQGKLYATYRDGACFLFEQAVVGLDGSIGDVTQAQWKEIHAHMDAIAPTIRFKASGK